jgi:DNA-binding CsgD family transcriptional regulator/tetratricopeptide (TPR) repeat protein
MPGRSARGLIKAPRLVGRDHEAAALADVLSRGAAFVMVEGEAGAGKSRLTAEVLADAQWRGKTLVGCCPPYRAPFTLGAVVDAVRQAYEPGEVAKWLGLTDRLRPLFPEWGGDLAATDPAADPGAARHALFCALAELLAALKVLVLVIEDVHWADPVTLEFLLHMASLRPAPCSIVLTYRDEEVAPGSLVRVLSSRLSGGASPAGGALSLRVTLGLLSVAQTGELVSSMLGGEAVSLQYAELLHAGTGGLPLAIEESVRLMEQRADIVPKDGSWARSQLGKIVVPPSVRDTVLERCDRLGEPATAVLRAAAVLGDPAPEPVLLAVADLSAADGRKGLNAALGARLLTESPGDLFGFRHALAGQAVYEAIPGPDRRDLHGRAAAALSTVELLPHAQLARHYRAAGDVSRWRRHGEAAADVSLSSGDTSTAITTLVDMIAHPGLDTATLHRLAAKVPLTELSDPELYQQLVSGLRAGVAAPSLTRAAEAQLRFQLGRILLARDDLEEGCAELARAVPWLRNHPLALQKALLLLAWRADCSIARRRQLLSRAKQVAVSPNLTDSGQRMHLAVDRMSVLLSLGDDEGWREYQRLPASGCDVSERLQLARAALNAGDMAMTWGRYDAARRFLDEALRRVVRQGFERLRGEVLATQLHLDWLTGNWAGLGERAAMLTASRNLAPLGRLEVKLISGQLIAATGAASPADQLAAAVEDIRALGTSPLIFTAIVAQAQWQLATGDTEAATHATGHAAELMHRSGWWLWAGDLVPLRVRLLSGRGELAEATALVNQFTRYLERRQIPAAIAGRRLSNALLAEAAGDLAGAAVLFEQVARQWATMPRPSQAAQAHIDQARCLAAAGGPENGRAAARALRTAHTMLASLGAAADAARVAATLRSLGDPAHRGENGGRRGYGNQLSPRELQVVALVAAGHTNREIASELHRSIPTVATQIRSAARKLDVSSRAAVAARAVQVGLLAAEPGVTASTAG